MSNLDGERDPFLPKGEVWAPEPAVLKTKLHETALATIDGWSQKGHGVSIYELADTKPRDAYMYVRGLFNGQFIDPETGNWGIGSPEEDGQMAFDGLMNYMAERAAPDPDIEEIRVVISVMRHNSFFRHMKTGRHYTIEQALNFTVGPQDLAF